MGQLCVMFQLNDLSAALQLFFKSYYYIQQLFFLIYLLTCMPCLHFLMLGVPVHHPVFCILISCFTINQSI